MKGLLGYGRYDDASEYVGCPRAASDMTPCVARDGDSATGDSGECVGCGAHEQGIGWNSVCSGCDTAMTNAGYAALEGGDR